MATEGKVNEAFVGGKQEESSGHVEIEMSNVDQSSKFDVDKDFEDIDKEAEELSDKRSIAATTIRSSQFSEEIPRSQVIKEYAVGCFSKHS